MKTLNSITAAACFAIAACAIAAVASGATHQLAFAAIGTVLGIAHLLDNRKYRKQP
jgi:hypothetical protein